MQLFQAPRLSPEAPQLNPCAWLWKWKGWSCSAPERKFSAPIVLSKAQEVVKTDSISYTLVLLAERITVYIMHRQKSLSGCSLTSYKVAQSISTLCPCTRVSGEDPNFPSLSHLQLSSNTLYKKLPASLPGVHQPLAFDFIPHTVDDVFNLIIREEIRDFT